MIKFIVEYEFKTTSGNNYWFPLFFKADSFKEANIKSQVVKTAIAENYDLTRFTRPTIFEDGITSEKINQYLKLRNHWGLEMLNFDVFRFSSIPTNPLLNFNEHLELVEFSSENLNDFIATNVERHRYPVRVFNKIDKLNKDYLLLRVVDPSNIEQIHITVLISDIEFKKSRFNLLNEGIWKDAHIKGYRVRVDAPHTRDEKRHVHISHPKNTTNKNKQVSWNDNKTRHDKKSFDQNFIGIEKAKLIAKRELNLDDDIILENLDENNKILLENIQFDFYADEVHYFQIAKNIIQ